ncbi:hypothetical protein LTS12_027985, partial [Elasticomyces elasticus]
PNQENPQSIAFSTFTRAALQAWKTDAVFQPYFHETGFIVAGHTPALVEHIQETEIDVSKADMQKLETAEDFRKTMPEGVLTGDFPGWKGWLHRSGAGWIHARKAMAAAFTEAIHRADRVILAAGAGSDRLLDFQRQLRPTAWTLCHIRMTPEEAKRYRNLPVLFNIAKGFFMEPDEDQHELKICDEHPGYCNFVPDPLRPGEIRSTPFARHQIPLAAEARARDFLQDTMPHLAGRPLAFARICWDADTPDRAFLIDRHPDHSSLLVAVGGSGNGAMQMPTIGGLIADALEGKLPEELRSVVRWRPETATHRNWRSTQDRFGGSFQIMDFQELRENEWTRIES